MKVFLAFIAVFFSMLSCKRDNRVIIELIYDNSEPVELEPLSDNLQMAKKVEPSLQSENFQSGMASINFQGQGPFTYLEIHGQKNNITQHRVDQIFDGTIQSFTFGDGGFMSLSETGGILNDGSSFFELIPRGDGGFRFRVLDFNPNMDDTGPCSSAASPVSTPCSSSGNIIIRVLPVFTKKACQSLGSRFSSFVHDSEFAANKAFTNSKIANVSVEMGVPIVVSDTIGGNNLNGDPKQARIHFRTIASVTRTRRMGQFDLVVLFAKSDSGVGHASVCLNESDGYAVVSNVRTVRTSPSNPYYTFVHEVGHLLGARHELEKDPRGLRYGHGWTGEINDRNIRTIMAVGGSNTKLYFSNPDVTYPGSSVKLGHSENANNARRIRETAGCVSRYRTARPGPYDFSLNCLIPQN